MYTALLVDDEQAVLDSLISGIAWQQFGVDKLLTASDGEQALAVIRAHTVDLLITDIRMPKMDGLQLLSLVREGNPDIHCILLTAYGEFEYARQAMKLGVENYLLKPFQKSEMEETIEKALDNIYVSREATRHLFRNNILLRWLTGTISSEELGERALLLNLNVYLPRYCAVCIRKLGRGCSLSAYGSAVSQSLEGGWDCHALWDDSGYYVLLIGGASLTASSVADALTRAANAMACQDSLILAIGSIADGSDDLSQSYQSARRLLESADYSRRTSFILSEEELSGEDPALLIRELSALFHTADAAERADACQAFARKLSAARGRDSLFSVLAHALFQLFKQEFPNKPGIQKQIYSRIHLCSAAPAQKELTSSVVELLEYSHLLFCYYFEQLSPVIQLAIGYIHRHYSESLSIKEFCVKNKMNTAYLGYLFKKETGMFFNNYLTQYRICCALELLRDSDRQINDISREVGFSTTSYFISCFKKQTGLSPIKYRAQLLDS